MFREYFDEQLAMFRKVTEEMPEERVARMVRDPLCKYCLLSCSVSGLVPSLSLLSLSLSLAPSLLDPHTCISLRTKTTCNTMYFFQSLKLYSIKTKTSTHH